MSTAHLTVDFRAHHAIVSDVQAELVTLCGSMRFFSQMLTVAAELTAQGIVVLAPFCVVPSSDQDTLAKIELDELHRAKIRLATRRIVVVSDETGYVGDSTRAEIAFAEKLGLIVERRTIVGRPHHGPAPSVTT
ncbi:hypothetical protein [Nocardia sp. XZ_19_231]|uniref:hypothetical protein n=1 Tax=Nocardia sp. XZ_19_231 TaxID=2769252 RepID=UPI00188FC9FD|nr:hypothetical protein [Nocardia sp. XZ_19_231]